MGGRGNAGAGSKPSSTKSIEELKNERKSLYEEYMNFINTHSDDGLIENDRDIATLMKMQQNLDSVKYDLYRQLSPVFKQEKWKGEGITDLTRDEAITVRQDMLKNKDMYMAISSAAHGVSYSSSKTEDTAVDTLYNNNPDKVYKTFEPTRKMLKQKYGDTMTLYRVPTAQTAKATVNMTSTRKNAEQYAREYGRRVEAIKVPVKNILAVNITRSGGYEEFIVLNRKRR